MLYTEESEERRGGEVARIERTRRKGREKKREERKSAKREDNVTLTYAPMYPVR